MVQTTIKHLRAKDYTGNLQKAVSYFLEHKDIIFSQEVGKYEVDPLFFYSVQEYISKDDALWEAHEKYIDIQIILKGEEIMEIAERSTLKQIGSYDPVKDFIGFEGTAKSILEMNGGDLTIFYPEDAHKPGLKSKKGNMPIRKCLFKILV